LRPYNKAQNAQDKEKIKIDILRKCSNVEGININAIQIFKKLEKGQSLEEIKNDNPK
jgi:hypothetical protein